MTVNRRLSALAAALTLLSCGALAAEDSAWVPIFNGTDLKDWVSKFEGKALGENPDNTFAVKDGMLFANNHLAYGVCGFGHLFYTKRKFSHYIIRSEYRFTQEKSASGFATWTNQNNGLMLHSQDPKTIPLAGTFPNSIEVQLLGPANTNESGVIPSADWPVGKTANLCTPQSFVSWKGKDHTQHCTPAQYPEAWKGTRIPWDREFSDIAVRVLGDSLITHHILGQTVFAYSKPRLDDGTPMKDGYISIQAEGTPTLFRKLEVLDLVGCMQNGNPAYRSYFVKDDPAACRVSKAAEGAGGAESFRFHVHHGRPVSLSAEGGSMGLFQLQALSLDGRVLAQGPGAEPLHLPASAPQVFLARAIGSFGTRTALMLRP